MERLAARPGARWYAAETGAGVTIGELRHGDVAVDDVAAHGLESGIRWGLRSEELGRFGMSGSDLSSHCGVGGSTQSTEAA